MDRGCYVSQKLDQNILEDQTKLNQREHDRHTIGQRMAKEILYKNCQKKRIHSNYKTKSRINHTTKQNS